METSLAALADPTRLAICRLLAREELSVRQLVGALGVSQPLVSHHLKVLRDRGLVRSRRASYWTFYRLDPSAVRRVSDSIADLAQRAEETEGASSTGSYRSIAPAPRLWGMSEPPDDSLDEAVERVADGLASEFVGQFSRPTVKRFLRDSIEHFAASGGRVPLDLAEQFSRQRLRAVARAEAGARDVPEVLFVCVKNAGRSQIAAALLERMAAGSVRTRSAGSTPAWRIDPNVAAVLEEIGVVLSSEFPKPLTDEFVQSADVVVTMGCGDACPVYEGKRYLDWDVPDPAGKPLEEVRAIRDEIAARVESLLADLEGRDSVLQATNL